MLKTALVSIVGVPAIVAIMTYPSGGQTEPAVITPLVELVTPQTTSDGIRPTGFLASPPTTYPAVPTAPVSGSITVDPMTLQILELRDEMARTFRFENQAFDLYEDLARPEQRVADREIIATALAELSPNTKSSTADWVTGNAVQSANIFTAQQAATLRYAIDRLEQVAATLNRAELSEEATQMRRLAKSAGLSMDDPKTSHAKPSGEAALPDRILLR
jgi:hypothetical protein